MKFNPEDSNQIDGLVRVAYRTLPTARRSGKSSSYRLRYRYVHFIFQKSQQYSWLGSRNYRSALRPKHAVWAGVYCLSTVFAGASLLVWPHTSKQIKKCITVLRTIIFKHNQVNQDSNFIKAGLNEGHTSRFVTWIPRLQHPALKSKRIKKCAKLMRLTLIQHSINYASDCNFSVAGWRANPLFTSH